MDSTRNEIEQSQNNFRQKLRTKTDQFCWLAKDKIYEFCKIFEIKHLNMIYPYGGGASEMFRMSCSGAT